MNQQNQFFNEIDVNTATNGTLGFKLGHAADNKAKTGVSVIYFPDGAKVGCDISGGGPASSKCNRFFRRLSIWTCRIRWCNEMS